MQEFEGKGYIDTDAMMVIADQEIELGIDDVRNLRVTVPLDDLEGEMKQALEEAVTDPHQSIIQIEVPLTMTITVTKK